MYYFIVSSKNMDLKAALLRVMCDIDITLELTFPL